MSDQEKVKKLIEEYTTKRALYCEFSERLKTIVEEVLKVKNTTYSSVEQRTKTIDSLKQKIELGKVHPRDLEDVHDLSGIRIITFVTNNIEEIDKVIQGCFFTQKLDVETKLGVDRVGYRSHHWVIELPAERLALPEYARFKGLKAELQVRTILQHAWAQIGHNQVYKPSSMLPKKIERDFTLLSGLLEIADNEFNRISHEIGSYQQDVQKKTEGGDLNIPIDSISLREYFNQYFADLPQVEPRFGPSDDMAEEIIGELKIMGIETLAELQAAIPEKLKQVIHESGEGTNYSGEARHIMIAYDTEKYFSHAWQNKWGIHGDNKSVSMYKKLGADMTVIQRIFPEAEL